MSDDKQQPEAVYVWWSDIDQQWRIRKWDMQPFVEGTKYTREGALPSTAAVASGETPRTDSLWEAMNDVQKRVFAAGLERELAGHVEALKLMRQQAQWANERAEKAEDALRVVPSSTGRMSRLTDEQIASVGAAVPAGRGYTERRDRAIADASAAFAISSIWRSEWVPVTERLPETHDESIGWLVFDGENVSHCRNHPSWWNYKDDRGTEHDGQKVTHWMPIPKGPK